MTTSNSKYKQWLSMSLDLKLLKEREMKLRKEICNDIFKGQVPPCTKKFENEEIMYKIEAKAGVSYKLDPILFNQLFKDLTDVEKNVVKLTPELKLREYKKLPDESKLHEAVTVKPATPTLKMIRIIEE